VYQLSCWFAGATVHTFLPGFTYHCPQQVSRSEDEQLCKSFRNGKTFLQKYTCTQTIFVLLLRITILPILRPTTYSSMCCSSFVSVVLFLQIGNTLQNCRHAQQRLVSVPDPNQPQCGSLSVLQAIYLLDGRSGNETESWDALLKAKEKNCLQFRAT